MRVAAGNILQRSYEKVEHQLHGHTYKVGLYRPIVGYTLIHLAYTERQLSSQLSITAG